MARGLITPETALRRVLREARPLASTSVALDDALGCTLAENIHAPIALPTFDNSAMDGYAVRAVDTFGASKGRPITLNIRGTIFAGDTRAHAIARGDTMRIMTGARMPAGADAVVPVEMANVAGAALRIAGPVTRGRHVRRKGEEVIRGERVVAEGATVHPGTVACLASLGRARVRVVRKPRVAVITTGDETVAPGRKLKPGQIYESNSYALLAMLREAGVPAARVRHVGDHYGALRNAVGAALRRSDVVLVTGGVSVGDRDYLKDVLKAERVRSVFWRVDQRPGKPLYFGTRGRRLVFGLPGNPASTFTCFYMYVYPALCRLSGRRDVTPDRKSIRAPGGARADDKRWFFSKGHLGGKGEVVAQLPRQGSHMVTSLAETNSLIVLRPGGDVPADGVASVVRLPYAEDVD